MSLLKKGIAEFIGTFVLVFFACGVAALTGGALVATALTFGLVIVAMAYSIGRISGCHINPAVSVAFLINKKMSLKEFGAYVGFQVLGGICGGLLVFGIAKLAGLDLLGDACNYFIGYNSATLTDLTFGNCCASVLAEVVMTCVFVYVILNATSEKADNSKTAGIIIGLTLTLVHLLGINLTGTSVNPARSIATAVSAAIYNGSFDALLQVWMFIVAPLVGGALAALLYKVLHKEEEQTN